jgi:hypothetical protein
MLQYSIGTSGISYRLYGSGQIQTGVLMLGKNRERWEELCELAVKEQDPEKLKELTDETNRLLEIKLNRLKRVPPSKG